MNKAYWKNRRVLVTGCTGFLGSYMVQSLVELGAEVTGLVRDFTPYSNVLCPKNNKINLVSGELEDIAILERALGEYEIDTVFHLAAQAIVGIANKNPISTFNANIRGTYNLMEACRRSPGVKNIVVASSDKAYGEQKVLPYVESMPLQGSHPYDVSKSCADLIAQTYFKTYDLPVCITRCGNLFGGGDLNFNRIVPHTIQSALFNAEPVIRSDGSYIRDYIYVEDAVMGYLLLSERMEENGLYGEAFNFSNEVRISVLELVRKILKIMKSSLQPIILNQASNEIKEQYLSAKKARELLGWKPYYNIDQGIEKTVAWYSDFLNKTIDSEIS